jgi:hypothetical protein
MANPLSPSPASCTSYASVPETALPEPPELDYRYFTPEFLDEFEEYYRAMAVGQVPA